MSTIRLRLLHTVGIYGEDEHGRQWASFSTGADDITCARCGATIHRGYVSSYRDGPVQHVCVSHVVITGRATQEDAR